MTADRAPPGPSRLHLAALALAVAGLLASWNPLAAPLGLLVGASATAVGMAAVRRGRRRRASLAAVVLGAVAFAVSAAVLGFSTGLIGSEPPGEAVVPPRSRAEVRALLDAAAERSRAARARAAAELEGAGGRVQRGGERGRGAGPRDGGR